MYNYIFGHGCKFKQHARGETCATIRCIWEFGYLTPSMRATSVSVVWAYCISFEQIATKAQHARWKRSSMHASECTSGARSLIRKTMYIFLNNVSRCIKWSAMYKHWPNIYEIFILRKPHLIAISRPTCPTYLRRMAWNIFSLGGLGRVHVARSSCRLYNCIPYHTRGRNYACNAYVPRRTALQCAVICTRQNVDLLRMTVWCYLLVVMYVRAACSDMRLW